MTLTSHKGVRNPYRVPDCAGTPDGRLRLTYLPIVEPMVVHNLMPHHTYSAAWINPIDGRTQPIDTVKTDNEGNWHAPLPPQRRHDWLLVIEKQ